MSSDPTAHVRDPRWTGRCERPVGRGDDTSLVVSIETKATTTGCPDCGSVATSKGRRGVSLVDCCQGLRTVMLHWLKRRWWCPAAECPKRSWTEEDRSIAAPRLALTDRAGRWATEQVGRLARASTRWPPTSGCDWHTVNDTVVAYGEALVADSDRFGTVRALGLDEVLFVRRRDLSDRQHFSTQLVDVSVASSSTSCEGRQAEAQGLAGAGEEWLSQVRFATLDLSATYKSVFDAICRTPSRWRIHSTWSSTPPSSSTSAAGGSNNETARSPRQEGRPAVPGPTAAWPRPTSAWTSGATRS